MRIDNCIIELDGPEPPGLDGSAKEFVDAIVDRRHRAARRGPCAGRWTVAEPILLRQGGATLGFYPRVGEELLISYILDYGPRSPISPQTHSESITPEHFQRNLSHCRTFVLEDEARELQRQGVGKHLSAGELLVFGPAGPIGFPGCQGIPMSQPGTRFSTWSAI